VSRSPAARLNRFASLLAGPSSSLRIADARDLVGGGMRSVDRRSGGTAVVLTARSRAARRSVGALELDAERLGTMWRRERGDTSVRLQTQFEPGEDTAAVARALVARLDAMLEALSWPLTAWSVDPDCLHG
jgi:hypothetical protein